MTARDASPAQYSYGSRGSSISSTVSATIERVPSALARTTPVEQVTTVAGGGQCCEYLVAKDTTNEHQDDRAAGASLLPVMELKGAPTR